MTPPPAAVTPQPGAAASSPLHRSDVAVIVPTWNAGAHWARFAAGLQAQGLPPAQVIVIDSGSRDDTTKLAVAEGFHVVSIAAQDFNHGGTRQRALASAPWARIAIYLTQDAVLADAHALDRLLAAFDDPTVAAACGRQLPRPGAGPIEAHARLFNYPAASHVRDFESRHTLGIKATFLSNSFAAYRVDRLCEVGGFPSEVIMAEDAIVAGRLLTAGYKIAYVAEAQVFHSHPYSIAEEFRRYFDTGVYHHREAWLRERFGNPGGEGKRFVLSELRHLCAVQPTRIPLALLKTAAKAMGYNLGLREKALGPNWSRRLSLHKGFWDRPQP